MKQPTGPSENLKGLRFAAAIRERVDSWVNMLTGLGTLAKDKVQSTIFQRSPQLSDETLEGMFHEDPIAAQIVEAMPQEAFRQGVGVTTSYMELEAEEKAEAEEKLLESLNKLESDQKLMEGATWGRLLGGGLVLIGARDGRQMNRPLDVEKVTAVQWLTVLDKRDLTPETYYADPTKGNFGEVETYRLNPVTVGTGTGTGKARVPTGTIVHETRLIRFGGVLTSRRERARLNGWDHSVLHRVQNALKSYASDWASVSNMLTDSSQGVLKIKGLYELLAGGQKEQFEERLEMVALARFVGRIMPIDMDEDFTYQERSFTGLSDLMDKTLLRLSAAARIPISILFGRAPAGLAGDAAGGSDLVKWNNQVKAAQAHHYGPGYDRLVRIVAQAIGIPEPDSWSVSWPNLWQMTPEVEANVRKLTADTDAVYVSMQALDSDEVRSARFTKGTENNLAPPQVELEAPPASTPTGGSSTPVPDPGGNSTPVPGQDITAPESVAELQDSVPGALRLDSPWLTAIPPIIADDLRALRQLSRAGTPQLMLRRILTRLAVNLGLGDGPILEAIAGAELRWDAAIFHLDATWPATQTTPVAATDLVAFETLVRVKAPQILLRALAARIAAGMGLDDSELQELLEAGTYEWISAMPGVDLNISVDQRPGSGVDPVELEAARAAIDE